MNIHESAQSILIDQQEFAPRFYEILFQNHPEVRPFFVNVDMHDQRTKLMTALITTERQASTGGWVSENYLKGLGNKHLSMGVGRELFPRFIDSLVMALREHHGADWTAVLETEWRSALDAAAQLILAQYPDGDAHT